MNKLGSVVSSLAQRRDLSLRAVLKRKGATTAMVTGATTNTSISAHEAVQPYDHLNPPERPKLLPLQNPQESHGRSRREREERRCRALEAVPIIISTLSREGARDISRRVTAGTPFAQKTKQQSRPAYTGDRPQTTSAGISSTTLRHMDLDHR